MNRVLVANLYEKGKGDDQVKKQNKQRNLNITLTLLATLSVGMFGYANVYQPNFVEENTVDVYVAKDDIPEKVTMEAGMFEKTQLEESAYIPGLVTDLNSFVDKQLTGELKAGEFLFEQRIDTEVHNDGPLIAELLIPTSIPLEHNDKIRVYVQYPEDGKMTIEELFNEKRVISRDNVKNGKSSIVEDTVTAATSTSANEGNMVYVRLTDKEVIAYQEAVNTGTLYAVKIEDTESKETVSSGKAVSERDVIKDEEADNSSSNSVAIYLVEDGDTIEGIAKKFYTTEERIKELNDGKESFSTGDEIHVPGN